MKNKHNAHGTLMTAIAIERFDTHIVVRTAADRPGCQRQRARRYQSGLE